MDPGHDSGTRADTKVTANEVTVKRIEKSKSTHSVSSSSSESSEEDFFQMDQKALPRSHTSPASSPKPLGDVQPEKIHESLIHSMSTTQYPPIQVMERTGDYEPTGLPSSIFARNSFPSKGWSITSNESLFSLNLGNNSLSRDQPLLFEDLYDREFYKSDELKKSGELNWYGQSPPPHVEGENDVKCVDMGEKSGETRVSDEKVVPNGNVHNEGEVKLSPPKGSSNSPIANCQSDGSGTSTQPLAFPRKKSSSAWRFCQCFHGWWTFCYDCKRERNACSSPSSEENLTNDGTRTSKKGSLEKKDSQLHSKKSWCWLTPCSCSFRCCC